MASYHTRTKYSLPKTMDRTSIEQIFRLSFAPKLCSCHFDVSVKQSEM
jgi:hypothetical protein